MLSLTLCQGELLNIDRVITLLRRLGNVMPPVCRDTLAFLPFPDHFGVSADVLGKLRG